MQGFQDFIKKVFTRRTVWVDRGEGRWVTRKQMHPLLRAIIGCGMAAVAAAAFFIGRNYAGLVWTGERVPAEQTRQTEQTGHTGQMAQTGPESQMTDADARAVLKDMEEAGALSAAASDTQDTDSDLADLPGLSKEDLKGDLLLTVVPDSVRDSVTEQSRQSEQKAAGTKKTNAAGQPAMPETGTAKRKSYWIRIDKGNYTLSLYRGQELVKTYNVAVGKNPGDKQRVGDNRTPVGNFRVLSIENASKWKHDFGDGRGKIAGAYGPWFIRLDTGGWKGIGIHGTHDPDSIGTMASEGCIRMYNDELKELKRYAYRNMPVIITD